MKIKKNKTRRVSKKPGLSKGKRKRIKRTKRTTKKAKKTRKKKVSLSISAKPSPLILAKFKGGPIISPKAENGWEAWQTFNPGVIFLDNKVHILYRAIGSDGISRLGYAVSYDGFKIDERLSYPVYQEQLKKEI